MKKLMIAAAIVCAAAMSQAAKVDWTLSAKNTIYKQDGSDAKSFNCYLIYAADSVKLAALTADLASGKVNADNITDLTKNPLYLGTGTTGSGTNSKGKIAKVSSDNSDLLVPASGAGYYDLVYVAFDTQDGKDYYYMSTTKEGQAWDDVVTSQTLAKVATWDATTYSASNWHQVSAVPEPTSGLLLLIGVAGMALKRKRA